MKYRNHRNRIHTPLIALALASGLASAGTTETTMAPAPAAPAEDVISGVLKLDYNSHFISYGADVWGDAGRLGDGTFNPSLELAFALPANFTFTLGTWWDVNNKLPSSIGGSIQEVDVWTGLSYTYDKFTAGVTYQQWYYGSDTEQVLDVKFAYDTFLSPSLTIHNRLEEGAANGTCGTILVLGLSHGIEAGPVSISFPLNVAFFLTDDFHNDPFFGGADSGFGYASLGIQGSLPLTPYIGDAFGDWTANAGLTYYVTDDGVIPNNPDDSFLTINAGLQLDF